MSSSNSGAPADVSSQAPRINAAIWTLLGLAGVFLGLRNYCKFIRRRRLWWDDYILIMSWIFLLASAISTTLNSRVGFGEHIWQIPPGNLVTLGILSNVSGFFSVLSASASKTSFATTLLRLSDGWMRILIWFIIISLNILMNLSALFFWVSCNPPEKTWNPTVPGKCWPSDVSVDYGIVVGAYSAACDFTLALLPWKILLRFHMYRREKIGVALAMSMGIFAGATGIIKCVLLPLLSNGDFTYAGAPFVIWGFAESAVTIMAASIPTLRVLFIEASGAPGVVHIPTMFRSNRPSTTRGGRQQDKASMQEVHGDSTDPTLTNSGTEISGQRSQASCATAA